MVYTTVPHLIRSFPTQCESCSCVMSWIAPPAGTCCSMATCHHQVQSKPEQRVQQRLERQHVSERLMICVTVYPVKRRNRHSVAGPQFMGGRAGPVERAPVRRSNTMPPNLGNAGILGKAAIEEKVTGLSQQFLSMFYSTLICFFLFSSVPLYSDLLFSFCYIPFYSDILKSPLLLFIQF